MRICREAPALKWALRIAETNTVWAGGIDDGSQNLVGAITTCMGNVGASNIAEFQQTEIIIAPSIKTEGKLFQTVQSVGMGTS